jgi:ATP-dependent DNA ligase
LCGGYLPAAGVVTAAGARLTGAGALQGGAAVRDEDLATVTRDLHLEGIVAKRLDAPYQAGRRRNRWLKYKHRHRARLTITAWRPGESREPDEVLVSRRDDSGVLRFAGGVRFGLTTEGRARLRTLLGRVEHASSHRSRARKVSPVIEVDVDHHGRPGGALRDPVLRSVYVSEASIIAAA